LGRIIRMINFQFHYTIALFRTQAEYPAKSETAAMPKLLEQVRDNPPVRQHSIRTD
jgi:hypothetical protein